MLLPELCVVKDVGPVIWLKENMVVVHREQVSRPSTRRLRTATRHPVIRMGPSVQVLSEMAVIMFPWLISPGRRILSNLTLTY